MKPHTSAETCPLCNGAAPRGLAFHTCAALRRLTGASSSLLSWRNNSW